MGYAGHCVLQVATKNETLSFASAHALESRFDKFCEFAKAEGVNKMERIDVALVERYALTLEGLKPQTQHAYISAINTVLSHATRGGWETISPKALVEERSFSRQEAPASYDRTIADKAISAVGERLGEKAEVIAGLARELGLRARECVMLDAKTALTQARSGGTVKIEDGTKGGRPREVPVSDRALAVLERAAAVQGDRSNLIPEGRQVGSFLNHEVNQISDVLRASCGDSMHDLRAGYACERYHDITDREPPCISGEQADKDALQTIAEELGHGRAEVSHAYVG
jgi:integrase